MPPESAVVREWLVKALNDLRTAQLVLSAKPPVLDTGCFHCQQTAEKSLKAFLFCQDVEPPQTQVVQPLVGPRTPIDASPRIVVATGRPSD